MASLESALTVSVVIPLYNGERFIKQTIHSVLAQTHQVLDIIVVDDGSTDYSYRVVEGFGEVVHLVSGDNRGVASARNCGISLAQGDFIALLDHDDLWDPAKLEKQLAVLVECPGIGMVVTDVAHIDQGGSLTGEVGQGYNPNETFARLFVNGFIPTPSSVLIRKTVIQQVGVFDERFPSAGLDDHEFWTRIADSCEIATVPLPLTFHRDSSPKHTMIALEHRSFLNSMLLERYGQDQNKKMYLLKEQAACLSDLGKHQIDQGKVSKGYQSLRKAFGLSIGPAKSWKTAWRCLSRMVRGRRKTSRSIKYPSLLD